MRLNAVESKTDDIVTGVFEQHVRAGPEIRQG